MSRIHFVGLLAAVITALGCNAARVSQLPGRKADLSAIYGPAFTAAYPGRNPVIFIHGVLGARLKDEGTGKVVWGSFKGDWANPATPEGARLIALPMKLGTPLDKLAGTVKPDGLLTSLSAEIFGLPISVQAYDDVAKALQLENFDPSNPKQETPNFQFVYDWRLSNVANAQRLHAFVLEKRALMQQYIERSFGIRNYDVKFDLIAHSMGGLITRYFLRYGDVPLPADGSLPQLTCAGARYVEKVILVGTPNAGFVGAQKILVKGLEFVPVFTPHYPSAVMATHPSWYEMMTRIPNQAVVYADQPGQAVDIYDLEVWKKMGWGLADPRQDKTLAWLLPDISDPEQRRKIALDHLAKCLANARQFQAALDSPAGEHRPKHLQMYLFSGDAIETDAVLAADPGTGRLSVFGQSPGDGIVTRASCLMDERVGQKWHPQITTPVDWDVAFFLRTDHMGITADPTFLDNLAYLLVEARRPGRFSSP